MYVTDFNGNEEPIVDFIDSSVQISRDLQGRYELSFTVVKTDKNIVAYNMIQDLVSITVEGEVFTVRLVNEDPYTKSLTCVHEFFDNIDVVVDEQLTEGTYTLNQALQLLNNSDSDWNFVSSGSFLNVYLEKFGDDNVISLLNELMDNYQFEYTLSSTDKTVRIYNKLGEDTDYQVRYGHNLVAISKSIDANNVKTHIKVKYNQNEDGDYQSVTTYVSPQSSNYPRPKWAKTVEYDTASEALARIYGASQIVDTPSISIQVEFVELQRNGYEGNEMQLGNSFYLIDERMNEEDLARIVEITTFPYTNRTPVVTVANRVKYYTDLSILQQQKQQLLDDQAVKKGENLDGVVLTEENGIEVKAENNRQVKIWINAQEGFTIMNGLVRKFYVDTMGNVTFDGRLNITNGDGITQMLEAFRDARGGRLNIFDTSGFKNISMGSEIAGSGYNGGIMQVFSDFDQNNPLVEISGKAANQISSPNGRIFLRDLNGTNTVEIKGSEGIGVTGGNGSYVSFLGSQVGYINGDIIVTQSDLSVYATQSSVNSQLNALQNWVSSNFQPL